MSIFTKKKKSRIRQDFYLIKSCFSLFFIFLWALSSSYAQSKNQVKIDSISSLLRAPNLNDKTDLYYQLSELYTNIDSTKAKEYVNEGLKEAKRKNDSFAIAKGNFTLAGLYFDYNKRLKAKQYYETAAAILSKLKKNDSSEKVLKLWVRSNFNIGVVVSYQGNFEQIKYLEKITPVAEKIEFYDILSAANTNLAIDFYNAAQFKKAHEYFVKSEIQYRKSMNYSDFMVDRLIFSSCLLEMDSLAAAKRELSKLEVMVDTVSQNNIKQLYYNIFGQYKFQSGKYEEAITNYKKAEKILKDNLIVTNDLQLYMDFMQAYAKKGDYRTAISYAERCIALASKVNNKVVEADIYKELSVYKKDFGKVGEAYEALAKYVAISDSLNIAELEKEVNRLESRYQSEKKEREILQLKNDNDTVELQLARKQSQNYFLLSISMGLLVLTGFAYLGYRNFRKKDKLKTAEINQLKYEQESKVYNAMLEGQENERKRLAIDLHDGLAGRLSATRIKLEKLAKKSENKKTEKDFKEAASYIDNSLTELRGIAMNLMPETLFKYGLKNAIEDYCSSIGSGLDDVKFILQFYDTEKVLPPNVALTIYRIIQELINNAVKHSKASEVLVQYLVENNKINITVEDNGQGFFIKDLKEKRGMGLNNLKTRVAYLNGEIDFDSNPDEGTNINIVINL